MPFNTCLAWSSCVESFRRLNLIFLAIGSLGLFPIQGLYRYKKKYCNKHLYGVVPAVLESCHLVFIYSRLKHKIKQHYVDIIPVAEYVNLNGTKQNMWFTAPPPAAATVAGDAPANRNWFCKEKSMLYHSAPLSTGFGGITRFGFSRTSKTYIKIAT